MPSRFIALAAISEIPPGEGRGYVSGKWRIALFHVREKPLFGAERSRFYALEDTCSHSFSPLSYGAVKHGRVACPLHGAAFDLKTGRACSPPATEGVRSFQVRIVGDQIEVGLPE
ncbi:MAG: non-heme iron oxygenase ferredoxin subunit [bacterium]